VGDEKECSVSWGGGFADEGAGLSEGDGCAVDDVVGEIVKYRRLAVCQYITWEICG
jgi:hypothetical protein